MRTNFECTKCGSSGENPEYTQHKAAELERFKRQEADDIAVGISEIEKHILGDETLSSYSPIVKTTRDELTVTFKNGMSGKISILEIYRSPPIAELRSEIGCISGKGSLIKEELIKLAKYI